MNLLAAAIVSCIVVFVIVLFLGFPILGGLLYGLIGLLGGGLLSIWLLITVGVWIKLND